MNSTVKTKSLIFACITAFLSMFVFTPFDATVPVVAIIAQIGFFSAVMASGFSPWQLSVPVVSYGIAFMLCGDPILALLSVVYIPVAVVIAICLRKKASRSTTVVLSSLTVGIVALGCGVAWALDYGIELSFESVAALIKTTANDVTNFLVDSVPDAFYEKNLSKEVYRATLYELFRYFSIGFFVLACNVVAFISTAITKLVVSYLCSDEKKISTFAKKWNFVLSKQSAVMFIICYLCLLVGGETLTLPQQIAFNTVFVAIQGGVLVMAFNSLRAKISNGGSYVLILYLILMFFFGLPIVIIALSVSGLFAVFKPKTKEGK